MRGMLELSCIVGQVPEPDFESLVRSRRVLVCAGCGGVGKTSVAAALSVAAARAGRRVLALTIDPAKRLAESLGVDADSAERQYIDLERASVLGIEEQAEQRPGVYPQPNQRQSVGELSVMILDPQKTLNDMVAKLSPSQEAFERITRHNLYRYLADYLAGANEYMAMEKLISVLSEDDFDLLVLDTPPTRHALDFLSAPEKLTDAIDGPIVKAVIKAVDGTSRFSLDLVARSMSAIIRGFGKFTGAGMLEQVATLIAQLNQIFGGFRERAEKVAEAFRDPSFAYLVVVRPDANAIEDGVFFMHALKERGMRASAVVVNRVHGRVDPKEARRGLEALTELAEQPESAPDSDNRLAAVLSGLEQATADHLRVVQSERAEIAKLDEFHEGQELIEGQGLVRVELPLLPRGVSNLESLGQLASHLVPGLVSAAR